jgi:hypothetical protein
VSTIEDFVFADVSGRVTCLTVMDNRATVGGEVTESTTTPFPVGSGLTIQVDDNEQAGTPDGVNVFGTVSPGFCPPPVFTQPMNRGNFVVHDATP